MNKVLPAAFHVHSTIIDDMIFNKVFSRRWRAMHSNTFLVPDQSSCKKADRSQSLSLCTRRQNCALRVGSKGLNTSHKLQRTKFNTFALYEMLP
eukprot:5644409-Amphidinium_carterae.1